MAKLNLTAKTVIGLKPTSERVYYFDTNLPGFCLAVTPKGVKTYSVMYRFANRLRRLTIGTTDQYTLKDARELAKDKIQIASKGKEDPAAKKREDRLASTFGELAQKYLEQYAQKINPKTGRPGKRSWKEDKRIIGKYLKRFKNIPAKEVRRADVRAMLNSIANDAPIMANRVFACIRKIYSWGISQEIGMVEHSPCEGLSAPSPENERERVLNDAEIKKLWKALEAETSAVADTYKIRLLTAQRGGEVFRMRWEDMDLDSRWWTIPAEFSKNGSSHRVWLSDPVIRILENLKAKNDKRTKRAGGPSRWVFPGKRKGKHLVEPKRVKAGIVDVSGIEDWRGHDLRRTAASKMTSIGIPRFVVGRILNHAEREVTAVYDRHSYDAEKKDALDRWAKHLMKLVSGLREVKKAGPTDAP